MRLQNQFCFTKYMPQKIEIINNNKNKITPDNNAAAYQGKK